MIKLHQTITKTQHSPHIVAAHQITNDFLLFFFFNYAGLKALLRLWTDSQSLGVAVSGIYKLKVVNVLTVIHLPQKNLAGSSSSWPDTLLLNNTIYFLVLSNCLIMIP